MIRFHRPDIGGLQEVLFSQLRYLREELPHYTFIGVGRDDGREEGGAGEYAPVFFKKNRFDLLNAGHFWLSEHPSTPGSKSWGTACTRLATWVVIQDIKTQEEIILLNTHLDHVSEEAQVKGSELIMSRLHALCEERLRESTSSSVPRVVVTGDFNSIPGSPPYLIFTRPYSSPSLSSTSLSLKAGRNASLYPPHGSTGTFTGWNHPKVIDGREEPLLEIDFIFVDERTKVYQYGVLCDTFDGRLPSDHRPVVADLIFSH